MSIRNGLLEQILTVTGGVVQSVTGLHVDNSDPKNPKIESELHFGAYTTDSILVGNDPDTPTYLSGVGLFPSSSAEFILLDAATGLVKNNSGRSFSMQGTATYQTNQGSGGAGVLYLWSERSVDDGVSFTENLFSLRTSEVGNNSANSQTKSSGVDTWEDGESIRWAMYRTGGAITLAPPSTVVNGGNTVDGLAFYWQLNET